MVKKRFDIIMIKNKIMACFQGIESVEYIKEPITKIFKGIVYHYICTNKSIYSTRVLEQFDLEEGD